MLASVEAKLCLSHILFTRLTKQVITAESSRYGRNGQPCKKEVEAILYIFYAYKFGVSEKYYILLARLDTHIYI